MRKIIRLSAPIAGLAIAAPALAHAGHHDANLIANLVHWVSQPSHGLTILAIAAAAGFAVYAKKQRG